MESLRLRLEEAEQALVVIRSGGVDALVVRGDTGEQVFSLRGADHTHRILLEGLNEAALTLTIDGTILYCNGRFQEMTQSTFPRLLGSSLFEFIPSDERHALAKVLESATHHATRREFHLVGKEGHLFPALFSTKGLESEGAQVLCMVITDITDGKRTENALHASERHYRTLYEEGERLREELQRLSGEVLRVQEEERRRISRDIHDEIGQALTAINLNVRMLKRKTSAEDIKRNLDAVQGLVDKASSFIHHFSHQIHPGMLEDLGLYPALRSFVREFEKNSGMRIVLKLHGSSADPTIDQKGAIYRIVQECLTNVLKHSGAHTAAVTIKQTPTEIDLLIVDNGRGFKVQEVGGTSRGPGGVGLLGMRERVRGLSGELSVVSRPGRGTRVKVRLPMQRAGRVKRKGTNDG